MSAALRSLRAAALPLIGGGVLLAAVLLLPDLTPSDLPRSGEQGFRAMVTADAGEDATGQQLLRVRLLDGPDAGDEIEAIVQRTTVAIPGSDVAYAPGDEVVVSVFSGPAGGFAAVSQPWRLPVLGLLAGIFAAGVLLVGGLRGLRSLVALALTLAVVAKLVIPLLLQGLSPIPLAVLTASGVTVATLLLTEGWRRATLAAILGTFAALALTAGLAAVFNAAARFSALQGSEEVSFLVPLLGERADLQGLLLAAIVFGALGVLDDVTMTQSQAVAQLRNADPASGRGRLFARAMEIGRSHIAATVNTLVLAYLGAALPLLMLFALAGTSPLVVANGELLAVEIVRALVGSIGIVFAVPFTTVVAVLLVAGPPALEPAPG